MTEYLTQSKQLIRLKEMRLRKAEKDLAFIRKKTKLARSKKQDAETRLTKRTATAAAYPQNRFKQLQLIDDSQSFFSSLAVSMYRMRREVASLSLRLRIADREFLSVVGEQQRFEKKVNELRQSLDSIMTAHNRVAEVEAAIAEDEAEEAMAEMHLLASPTHAT